MRHVFEHPLELYAPGRLGRLAPGYSQERLGKGTLPGLVKFGILRIGDH